MEKIAVDLKNNQLATQNLEKHSGNFLVPKNHTLKGVYQVIWTLTWDFNVVGTYIGMHLEELTPKKRNDEIVKGEKKSS